MGIDGDGGAGREAALRPILARMGLIAPGEAFTATPLAGGVSSDILRIDAGGRRFCLKQALPRLKVAKEWHAPTDRVFAEFDWLSTVAGFLPEAVPSLLGLDREASCFAMDYLPEADFPLWKARLLAGEVDAEIAAQVGARLGLVHARSAGDPALARRFAHDASFFALRLEPYLVETARQHPRLAAAIGAVLERTQRTKLALVHGDVSPKNILLGPSGPVFLDAECACHGDPAFDLAFCLNHLLLKAVRDPTRAAALLHAAARLAAAHRAAVDWEAPAALEARVAALLPCLALARIDGKSPVEYLDEAQRDAVRRAAGGLIECGPAGLAGLLERWRREAFA